MVKRAAIQATMREIEIVVEYLNSMGIRVEIEPYPLHNDDPSIRVFDDKGPRRDGCYTGFNLRDGYLKPLSIYCTQCQLKVGLASEDNLKLFEECISRSACDKACRYYCEAN